MSLGDLLRRAADDIDAILARRGDDLDAEVADLKKRNAHQQSIIEESHRNNARLREEVTRLQRARAPLIACCKRALARLEFDAADGAYDCTCADGDPCELHALREALGRGGAR